MGKETQNRINALMGLYFSRVRVDDGLKKEFHDWFEDDGHIEYKYRALEMVFNDFLGFDENPSEDVVESFNEICEKLGFPDAAPEEERMAAKPGKRPGTKRGWFGSGLGRPVMLRVAAIVVPLIAVSVYGPMFFKILDSGAENPESADGKIAVQTNVETTVETSAGSTAESTAGSTVAAIAESTAGSTVAAAIAGSTVAAIAGSTAGSSAGVTAGVTAGAGRTLILAGDMERNIFLPDKSNVWINRNSSIEFDVDFTERRIALIGEAYFDVADAGSDFIVQAEGLSAVVTGTRFNMVSHPGAPSAVVSLYEGSLAVERHGERHYLDAGSELRYDREAGQVTAGSVDGSLPAWLYRAVGYVEMRIVEIFEALEMTYGTPIVIDGDGGEFADERVTLWFERAITLDGALAMIEQLSGKFTYRHDQEAGRMLVMPL